MQFLHLIKKVVSALKYKIDIDSRRIQAFVKDASAGIADGSSVLDAGAGECQYKPFFVNKNYVAVDSGFGEMNWDYSKLDLICNLETLPFKHNVYEAVICTQVLEHVSEPVAVLEEILRVLKPDGTLCLSAPQGWGVHQPPHDYYRYTQYGLQYIMEKAGFIILSIQPVGGFYNYLANRLTVLPKTIFWQIETKFLRAILFPMEILFYFFFVLFFPFLLNRLDFLDKKRDYTLNYLVKGQKPKNI